MGSQKVSTSENGDAGRRSMRGILRDLEAMETMIERGLFESDRQRIGMEQELMLVDSTMQPASVAPQVLERVDDERVVPEIARFNLEFNGDPVDLGGGCFSAIETQLRELYTKVDGACREIGVRALMSGICPTVDLTHVSAASMMPRPRYAALDNALRELRGDHFELRIDGPDELIVRHPSIMLEAVNTSFQVHLQIAPEDYASSYNTSLAVAAPVLGAAVYSPILFGKRLWRETRIAIFQQVVDTRAEGAGHRDFLGRVRFGDSWMESSVLEVLRADVARLRQIIHADVGEQPDPIDELAEGRVPKLRAWQAFNSSVYRWMRPCYGVTDGRPHLRIENRVLPSGPTIGDEVANAAFWIGLMLEVPHRWPDLTERLDFKDARGNFLRAAREGLAAHMTWVDGHEHPIGELILREFLPAARDGLARVGVDDADVQRLMGTIERRVTSRQTGSHWVLRSVARMRGIGSRGARLSAITRAMLDNQDTGKPVHEWPEAPLPDTSLSSAHEFARVSQCMTSELCTVGADDCIDLVASIMDWEHVRHIPVEDGRHRLVGLVSYRKLLRAFSRGQAGRDSSTIAVSEIMEPNPVTVSPDTPTLDAIRLMCEHKVSCLPVVEDGRLVGIVSDRDYTTIARSMLERVLQNGAGE